MTIVDNQITTCGQNFDSRVTSEWLILNHFSVLIATWLDLLIAWFHSDTVAGPMSLLTATTYGGTQQLKSELLIDL